MFYYTNAINRAITSVHYHFLMHGNPLIWLAKSFYANNNNYNMVGGQGVTFGGIPFYSKQLIFIVYGISSVLQLWI